MADASSRISGFLADEYRAAEAAINAGQIKQARRHLERAHVVAQTKFSPHLQLHWKMLLLAVRMRDGREALGQLAASPSHLSATSPADCRSGTRAARM